ncbi:RNA polymerase sigma factor [Maribacter sp. 2307UL18-2]|uniref:RNA polymerase sigma factor n=1 Tax=Maribacter sp. 2307UL18-2 TaxID=3386274 RepID=UPI0039BD0C1F
MDCNTILTIETILLKNIAQGNQEAFKQLYVLYKNKVYNTAIGYLQNIEEAEEITQDVFLTIYNKANTFKGKSKVGTWIYRITVNKALNQLEKKKRSPLSGNGIMEWESVDFDHPGIQLENKEKARFLFAEINKLSENQKTAFLLSYVEGLPRQEVADIMEITLKSVESLLQRAKQNLRKQLIAIYPEGNQKK